MIWSKTEAGKAEMQTRALVKERARRNLLLLVDGIKTEEVLLASVSGVTLEDLRALESLALVVSSPGSSHSRRGSQEGAASAPVPMSSPMPLSAQVDTLPPEDEQPLDYPQFTATLTRLISAELGLRGFTLTLAVEKASSIEALRDVATRVIAQIRERKGEDAAEQARRALYGS